MESSRPGSSRQKQRRRSILTSTVGGNNAGARLEEGKVQVEGIQSVFRSPSLEDKLASLGIDLSSARGMKEGGEEGSGGRSVEGKGKRSARLGGSDISKRISGINASMEVYDRKVRDVQETMQTAYRKTVQDRSRRLKQPGGGSGESGGGMSSDLEDMDAETFLYKCRQSLKKDLLLQDLGVGPGGDGNNNLKGIEEQSSVGTEDSKGSSPRKYFGLDNEAVLKSSEEEESGSSESSEEDEDDDEEGTSEESSSSEEEQPTAMKISIRQQQAPKGKEAKAQALRRLEENVRNKKKGYPPPPPKNKGAVGVERGRKKSKVRITKEDLMPPRSLSPIMPGVPDKQFQNLLERREERVSRQLNTMKNELAQLNQKVEMDKRKAREGPRGVMPRGYQGRPMRMMKPQPEKNVGAELSSFVQSTGGPAGGWDRKDHNSFLKIFDVWRKHPTKLMETLKKELPHKKPQEIAGHIKWFERFEQLSSANRQNVHQWTQEKRRESELIYQMGSASQRAKLEGDKRRQEHLRMIREQERDRGKEKLAQWKRSQAVRSATSACSSAGGAVPAGPSHVVADASSSSTAFRQGPPSTEYRPATSVAALEEPLDTVGVRHQVLELAAKVHAMDHPKRDFRPPRPSIQLPAQAQRRGRRGAGGDIEEMPVVPSSGKLGVSASFTSLLGSRPPTPPPHASTHQAPVPLQRIKLPEIEPEAPRTRPTSSSAIRPPSGSLLHQQHQRNRRLIAGFRERDSKLVEAKRKAVEIARERRKSNISQLTPEEIKRRIRSRVSSEHQSGSSTPTFLNPTKQSELRKTLTHLERLEMLSKQDITAMGGTSEASGPSPVGGAGDMSSVMLLSNLPTKGIPSWRRASAGSGDYF